VVLHTFHGHVFHSYFSPAKTRLYIEIEKFLARKSTCIIAISNSQKDELCANYKICQADKIEVVRLGFDLAKFQADQLQKRIQFREQYKLDEDEVAIGIIGRLVPVKNHSFFLEVLKEVFEKTDKKVRAFIIGDGEERSEIERKAKDLDLDFTDCTIESRKSKLSFTSWIRDIDVAYAGLDIITLTSLNEGTPVSLIEAQAANKPIVATRVGGIENIVLKNETALLSENRDKETFVNNLVCLVENKEKRVAMGLKGWTHVNKTFHYDRLINDMDILYRKLLNHPVY
jgi:glycosyltransferase involved in cell wall biosynthesis